MAKRNRFVAQSEAGPVRVVLERRGGDVLHFEFWLAGKRYRESTGETVDRNARKVARSAVEEAALRHVRGAGHLPLKLTVQEYLDTRWPDGAGETHRDHKQRLNAFAKASGEALDLGGLTDREARRIVQAYLDGKVTAKLSAVTVSNDARAIHRFFAWLMKREAVSWQVNPATKNRLDLPDVPDARQTPVTADDLATVLREARQTKLWPLVLLTYGTGLRPSGALKVTVDKLDLFGKIVVTHEKGEARTVRLLPWVAKELAKWLEDNPREPGERLYLGQQTNASYQMRKLQGRAGLGSHVTLKALQKCHESLCWDSGMLPQHAAWRMGHSVTIAEKHYVAWKSLNESAATKAMDAALRKQAARPPQKPPQNRHSEGLA